MELIIYTPKEGEFIKEISFNHDEIKAELELRLDKYKGLVYTEDSIKEAKTDRATLNKFKDAIETRRKEIKKQCLKPYDEFEAKIKEIVAMIDSPILAIDGQVKAFEQAKKDEKLAAIKQFYADNIGGLADLISFDRIYNPRWMNATYKKATIQEEITNLFNQVDGDLGIIAELKSEYELQIKDTYLKSFDLSAALQEKTRLEEQEARLAEYKRRMEEMSRQREEQQKAECRRQQEQQAVDPASEPTPMPEEKPAIMPEQPEPKLTQVDFRVYATKEQLQALAQFMRTSGIKYGEVPTQEAI